MPHLTTLTAQQVFDAAAYNMLAHGGSPRDLFIKADSKKHLQERRRWSYFVRQGRAPKHCALLIADLETLHREAEPEAWPARLVSIAHAYNLEPPSCTANARTSRTQTVANAAPESPASLPDAARGVTDEAS